MQFGDNPANKPALVPHLKKVVSAQLCSFLQKNDIYEEISVRF